VRWRFRLAVQVLEDRQERGERIADFDDGMAVGRVAWLHDDSRRRTSRKLLEVLVVFQKGDVPGASVGEGSGGIDLRPVVPHDLAAHQFSELPDGVSHDARSFLP
jgi:hypothetical protein